MAKFGDTVVVRKHKQLGEYCAVAVMCDESNNKWWRVRLNGSTIDLGIKTFKHIDNIVFQDGEVFERLD